jgi:DNA-binding CsgD family transcriptional regulator
MNIRATPPDGDRGGLLERLAFDVGPLSRPRSRATDLPDAGRVASPFSPGTDGTPAGADGVEPLRVLVFDTMALDPSRPGLAVAAVSALLTQMGVVAATLAAGRIDALVLVVHDGERRRSGVGDHIAWERPARLTETCRQIGLPVIAVGMGCTALALAACVEQGAVAVTNLDDVPTGPAWLARKRLEPLRRATDPPPPPLPWGHRASSVTFEALTRLTPTERRVLHHLTEGQSAGEIATELLVSLSTVRAHIRSILRKLDVTSQVAAVAIANGAHPATHRSWSDRAPT